MKNTAFWIVIFFIFPEQSQHLQESSDQNSFDFDDMNQNDDSL